MKSVRRRAARSLSAIIAGNIGRRRICIVLLVMVAVGTQERLAIADSGDATSTRAAREEAVRLIPWRQLPPQSRRDAQRIVNDTSIYRRLPTRIIDCDPDLFTFLVQHPEVVIDVWRLMGLSQVALERQPGGAYRGTDGAGTTGTVRFLYSDWRPDANNLAVIYADGAYEGKPFVAPLKAQSLFLLRSGSIQETNGRHYITVHIDSFIRLEQVGVELVAKTIQPWINKTADQNLVETLSFVSNFSRTAERNPDGMKRLADRLPSIDEPTRNELVTLSFRTARRSASRPSTTHTGTVLPAARSEFAMAGAEWIGPAPANRVLR